MIQEFPSDKLPPGYVSITENVAKIIEPGTEIFIGDAFNTVLGRKNDNTSNKFKKYQSNNDRDEPIYDNAGTSWTYGIVHERFLSGFITNNVEEDDDYLIF